MEVSSSSAFLDLERVRSFSQESNPCSMRISVTLGPTSFRPMEGSVNRKSFSFDFSMASKMIFTDFSPKPSNSSMVDLYFSNVYKSEMSLTQPFSKKT